MLGQVMSQAVRVSLLAGGGGTYLGQKVEYLPWPRGSHLGWDAWGTPPPGVNRQTPVKHTSCGFSQEDFLFKEFLVEKVIHEISAGKIIGD